MEGWDVKILNWRIFSTCKTSLLPIWSLHSTHTTHTHTHTYIWTQKPMYMHTLTQLLADTRKHKHAQKLTVRNNKDTIRQFTNLYYYKSKIATCFGCTREPSSGRMFQQCKKENCIAVVIQLQVETNGRDLARTCSFVKVTPVKHFYNI